jgi:hypothetical protein
MLEWAADSKQIQVAERVTKLSSLRPSAAADLQATAVSLISMTVMRVPRPDPWILMADGMLTYRLGGFEAEEKTLLAAESAIPIGRNIPPIEGTCGYYRAMSLFQAGRQDEARALFRSTLATMKPFPSDEQNPLADGASHDDLVTWLACKEAQELLGE